MRRQLSIARATPSLYWAAPGGREIARGVDVEGDVPTGRRFDLDDVAFLKGSEKPARALVALKPARAIE